MKKILTLVLALVLVFAIAAPALAITGDTTTTPTPAAIAPVSLEVALFNAAPAYQYDSVLSYSAVAANKAYIVNELVFWGVALDFVAPEADKTELSMDKNDYEGALLTVSSDAFKFEAANRCFKYDATAKKVVSDTEALALNATKNTLTYTVAANNGYWGTDNDLFFFGQGVVAAKGVLKATLVKDSGFDAVGDVLYIFEGTDSVMNVLKETNGYVVYDAETEHWVRFIKNGKDEVTEIQVSVDNNVYVPVLFTVPVSGGGAVVSSFGTVTAANNADLYADYLEVYENVMSFFGFDYNAKGKLQDKHFTAKASGLNLKDEAVINLYTADIVVPGGVNPPKTGDAATVVGFVMIVLAMVACGVVVSRKVRA